MHTIKLLVTYYLNISVQAANLSDCRIEKIDSVARIESKLFWPELECSTAYDKQLTVGDCGRLLPPNLHVLS